MSPHYPAPEHLIEPVHTLLTASFQGLSEYEFLRQLGQVEDYFAKPELTPLELYQRHFLLFHCLYRLQPRFFHEQTGILQISPLKIRLWPYRACEQKLTLSDPLRDYYLDLVHLDTTSATQVDDLLDQFWGSLGRNVARQNALKRLDLCEPVSNSQIRQRYRALVMQHHPDRGGDNKRIQELNIAIEQLLPKNR